MAVLEGDRVMPTQETAKPTELSDTDIEAVVGGTDNKPAPPPPPPTTHTAGRFQLDIAGHNVGYLKP
jgi:hypothetical protein